MTRIELRTAIHAPRERCFDLARSVELHIRSTAWTGETAIAGRTTGLLGLGEEVTWRARHFGIWQRLTSRITAYERPAFFRDSMVRGTFARLEHEHRFADDGAVMDDVFEVAAPGGWSWRATCGDSWRPATSRSSPRPSRMPGGASCRRREGLEALASHAAPVGGLVGRVVGAGPLHAVDLRIGRLDDARRRGLARALRGRTAARAVRTRLIPGGR